MAEPKLKGKLLVAQPVLKDPNFERAVVLVLQHGDEGAIGVVLNRPTPVPAADAVPRWSGFATPPARVFAGGPVADDQALICLARLREGASSPAFQPLGDDDGPAGPVGTLDIERSPAEVTGVDEIRLFAGYAGWSEGQLEAEVAAGGWFVVDALPVDGFTSDPGGLWRGVMGRQHGFLAWFASFPPDPRLN